MKKSKTLPKTMKTKVSSEKKDKKSKNETQPKMRKVVEYVGLCNARSTDASYSSKNTKASHKNLSTTFLLVFMNYTELFHTS